MSSRGSQAVASIVLLACAYWCYARTIVPWVGAPAARDDSKMSLAEQHYVTPTARYDDLLAAHFPKGSWQRSGDARILKNDEILLVLREDPTSKEGMLHLKTCTLVYLPQTPDSRAWKIEAGGGVDLEFDKPFDVRSGKMGKLVGGFLPGEVSITSELGGHETPGSQPFATSNADPREKIEIETSGVQLTEERITAPYDVHFRYGPSFGSGRGLTIDLKSLEPDRDGRAADPAKNIEVRRIELVALEQLVLYPPPTDRNRLSADPVLPLRVHCAGPVVFDLEAGIAHMEKNVLVERARQDQSPDRLQCDRLTAHLLRVPRTTLVPSRTGISQGNGLSAAVPDLQLERVVAEGLPAIVTSTSGSGKESRWHRFESERLEYSFETRRGQLEPIAGHAVRANEMKLGAAGFRAGGSGRYLTGVPSERVTQMELRWRDRMELDTSTAGVVNFLLVGDTICRLQKFGHVFAQQLRIGLTGSLDPNQLTSSANPAELGRLRPNKIVAEGSVQIHTERLNANTNRLDVDFRVQAPLQPPIASAGRIALDAPRGPSLGSALGVQGNNQEREGYGEVVIPERKFAVKGDRLRINILETNGEHELEDVLLQGRVECVETSVKESESPVVMTGSEFRLSHFTQSSGLAVIKGQPAEVRAQQMAISGNNIHVDRDQNEIWIDGRGAAKMPLPARIAARFPNRPAVAYIHWEGGLRFDGKTIRCQDRVLIQGPAQRIRAQKLVGVLTQSVDLTATKIDAKDVELETITAEGNVDIQNRTMDDSGWLSMDRASVRSVVINYQAQSIEGVGPGWIETVRRPEADDRRRSVARVQHVRRAAANAPLVKMDGRLMYLRVEFAKGFHGSMARKTLTFRDQIRSVFGPVPNWDSRLEMQAGELRPESARLSCHELNVFQVVGRVDSPFELSAIGNTQIHGKSTTGQLFSATAQRLSFDPGKDLLMLHGDPRSKAQLSYQSRVGGARSTLDADRIEFWPKANRYKLQGGMLDLNDFGR